MKRNNNKPLMGDEPGLYWDAISDNLWMAAAYTQAIRAVRDFIITHGVPDLESNDPTWIYWSSELFGITGSEPTSKELVEAINEYYVSREEYEMCVRSDMPITITNKILGNEMSWYVVAILGWHVHADVAWEYLRVFEMVPFNPDGGLLDVETEREIQADGLDLLESVIRSYEKREQHERRILTESLRDAFIGRGLKRIKTKTPPVHGGVIVS